MAYRLEDLGPLEVALLGVLCVGLPPSRAAGDDTFRLDHVTAVVAGLGEEGRRDAHLTADGVRVAPAFRQALRTAIEGLVTKGLLAYQPAGMPAAAGGFERGLELDLVDPDEQPALLDRYLGQACMEKLFNVPAVYPYLMERYSRSGEVWRRLREGGYGR
ncbi:MAG: hypothetical protein ACR2HN_11280 [Tepidiformaceae bacterium]